MSITRPANVKSLQKRRDVPSTICSPQVNAAAGGTCRPNRAASVWIIAEVTSDIGTSHQVRADSFGDLRKPLFQRDSNSATGDRHQRGDIHRALANCRVQRERTLWRAHSTATWPS